MKFPKLSVPLIVAGMASVAMSTPSEAASINLNHLLTNPSFEGGLTGNCPTGWTCPGASPGTASNNFRITAPTPAQYPAPNGLASGVVPNGSSVAFTPATGANGILLQSLSGQQYSAGNSYVLEFWIGNPLGGVFANRIDVQLTAGATSSSQSNTLCDTAGRFATLVSGAQSANDNGTQCLFSLNNTTWLPADGDWRLYTLTFTTNANIVGDIGVRFHVFTPQSAANGALVHLDLPGLPVTTNDAPEPATLALLGLGLLGLSAARRRKTA